VGIVTEHSREKKKTKSKPGGDKKIKKKQIFQNVKWQKKPTIKKRTESLRRETEKPPMKIEVWKFGGSN